MATLLLIPFSGVLADRWSRRDLLMLVQVLGISVSAALTIMMFLDVINFGSLLILSVLNGMLKGLDMPVRHTIVTETVDDRVDWGNAIVLNSVMLSSSKVLGPAIGGILIATVGVQYCFLYDTLSYVPAIVTLKAMQMPPKASPTTIGQNETWQKLREGFHYVSRVQPIRNILLLLALQGLMGISYIALLPVFAAEVLHGSARIMAALGTAAAVGSLVSCAYLSTRRSILGLERLIMIAQGAIGLSLISFSLSRHLGLSILMLALVGGFSILQVTSSNTIIQTLVTDDKRGRVMSFYALATVGMTPFGNLLAGSLAHVLGAPIALIVCGSFCIAGSLWFSSQVPQVTRWIQREINPRAI